MYIQIHNILRILNRNACHTLHTRDPLRILMGVISRKVGTRKWRLTMHNLRERWLSRIKTSSKSARGRGNAIKMVSKSKDIHCPLECQFYVLLCKFRSSYWIPWHVCNYILIAQFLKFTLNQMFSLSKDTAILLYFPSKTQCITARLDRKHLLLCLCLLHAQNERQTFINLLFPCLK